MKISQRNIEVLAFIRSYWMEHQYSPSLPDIGAFLQASSTSGPAFHVGRLKRAGLIKVHDSHQRSIRPTGMVVRLPALAGDLVGMELPEPDLPRPGSPEPVDQSQSPLTRPAVEAQSEQS